MDTIFHKMNKLGPHSYKRRENVTEKCLHCIEYLLVLWVSENGTADKYLNTEWTSKNRSFMWTCSGYSFFICCQLGLRHTYGSSRCLEESVHNQAPVKLPWSWQILRSYVEDNDNITLSLLIHFILYSVYSLKKNPWPS